MRRCFGYLWEYHGAAQFVMFLDSVPLAFKFGPASASESNSDFFLLIIAGERKLGYSVQFCTRCVFEMLVFDF